MNHHLIRKFVFYKGFLQSFNFTIVKAIVLGAHIPEKAGVGEVLAAGSAYWVNRSVEYHELHCAVSQPLRGFSYTFSPMRFELKVLTNFSYKP